LQMQMQMQILTASFTIFSFIFSIRVSQSMFCMAPIIYYRNICCHPVNIPVFPVNVIMKLNQEFSIFAEEQSK
jgi:hypothetical protein